MTGVYEFPLLYGPMDILCPACGAEALFRTSHDLPLPVTLRRPNGTIAAPSWEGQVSCTSCGQSGTHYLDWQHGARFKIEHNNEILWAKDRDVMVAIRGFIAETAKRGPLKRQSKYSHILVRIPSVFLKAGDRAAILKQIDRTLEGRS